ncbi:MAG: tellurite resistance TerB family protein [Acetobacteraceae bacterium]|nr:tellurite resistance TerB family protein [Acetobacteraceae bacterium]
MTKKSPASPDSRTSLTPEEALICTIVLVAAADGAITDREIGVMSGLVQTLPAFFEFSSEQLEAATDAAITLLGEDEGLSHAGQMIRDALEPRLRETAYTLACDIVAASTNSSQPVLRMLELVGSELRLDPLVAAAIERAARARHQRVRPAAEPKA